MRILAAHWRLRLALVLLSLAACATPTPYQPAIDGNGYGEQRLEADRYRVWFAGNAVTPRQTVENYLLYRAAEITLETGHHWFRIADHDTEAHTEYWTTGCAVGGPGFAWYRQGHGPFDPTYCDMTNRPSTRYAAFAVISVHTGSRPANDDQTYTAIEVVEALGPTLLRPEATR